MAMATSDRVSLTNWPSPVSRRWRSAVTIPSAAVTPVTRSQAGRAWLIGLIATSPWAGPVANGMPTAQLTV